MEPKDLNSSESNSSQESNATESNATGPDTQVEEVVSEPTWLDGVMQEGALGMLLEGGAFMWPILILAIVGLAVVIERFRSLKMLDSDDDSFVKKSLIFCRTTSPRKPWNACARIRMGPWPRSWQTASCKCLVLKKLGHDQRPN